MPTVKKYGASRVTTQVAREQRFATPRVPDTATPILQGLQSLQAGLAEGKQRADETAAEDALINFERDKNNLFFNPDDGYFNKRGRDAYDGAEDMNKSIQDLQKKYSTGLTSPEARKAFDSSARIHTMRAETDINKHAGAGLDSYELATMKARSENSIESAMLYWDDPKESEMQRKIGRNATLDQATRLGLDNIATNEALQNFESKFTRAQIEAAMANDLSMANGMFETYGKRLEGPDLMAVEVSLDKANFDSIALDEATKVVGNGSRSLTDMVADVNTMPIETAEQATLKTEVMRQVKNAHTLNKAVENERSTELYEGYAKQVQDGDIKSRDIPGSVWQSMTVTQRSAIHKIEKLMAGGDTVITDDTLFSNLLLLPTEELAKVDPTMYFDRIGGADRDKLNTAVKSARNGKKDDDTSIAITRATQTSSTMREIMGKKPAKYNSDELKTANSIQRTLNSEVQYRESELKRKLLPDEYSDLLKGFTRTVIQERSLGGVDWLYRDKETKLTDIPADMIDDITARLHQLDQPATSTNIISFYQQGIEQGLIDD